MEKLITVIDNAFNNDEFQQLNKSNLDYNESHFGNNVDTEIRLSKQINIIDYSLANLIFNKVNINEVMKVNECLRYIKYDANGYFKLHYDDNIEKNGFISKYTIIIYLNTCDSQTVLIDDGFTKHYIDCIENRMVIFDQDIEHEATNINEKYIIRTDCMVKINKDIGANIK